MPKRRSLLVAGFLWTLPNPFVTSASAQSTRRAPRSFETHEDAFAPGILIEELEGTVRAELPAGVALRRVSSQGVRVTKEFEGWRNRLYNDAAQYCTIGYGHLIKKARCDGSEVPEFLRGITEPRGEELLRGDMRQAQIAAMTLVDVPLKDGEYAALVDFIFNVGIGNFQRSSLREIVNARPAGDRRSEVPFQFLRWTKAGGREWPGLKRRREREVNLFFDGNQPRAAPPADTDLIDIRTGERSNS